MRIPANAIETKYTSGNEFVFDYNYKYYQGYYYEFNGKYFAGKTFNANAPKLVKAKSTDINSLLTNPKTFIYGSISQQSIPLISKFIPMAKSNLDTDTEGNETYYAKKINVNPTTIKEIDKKTFDKLKQDPFYQIVSLKSDRSNLDDADKKIPGLKAFLLG